MPAHVSHLLFAEEAVRRLGPGGERLLAAAGNALRLGAQGPGPVLSRPADAAARVPLRAADAPRPLRQLGRGFPAARTAGDRARGVRRRHGHARGAGSLLAPVRRLPCRLGGAVGPGHAAPAALPRLPGACAGHAAGRTAARRHDADRLLFRRSPGRGAAGRPAGRAGGRRSPRSTRAPTTRPPTRPASPMPTATRCASSPPPTRAIRGSGAGRGRWSAAKGPAGAGWRSSIRP